MLADEESQRMLLHVRASSSIAPGMTRSDLALAMEVYLPIAREESPLEPPQKKVGVSPYTMHLVAAPVEYASIYERKAFGGVVRVMLVDVGSSGSIAVARDEAADDGLLGTA